MDISGNSNETIYCEKEQTEQGKIFEEKRTPESRMELNPVCSMR